MSQNSYFQSKLGGALRPSKFSQGPLQSEHVCMHVCAGVYVCAGIYVCVGVGAGVVSTLQLGGWEERHGASQVPPTALIRAATFYHFTYSFDICSFV